MSLTLLIAALLWILIAFATAHVADIKGRSGFGGFLLGLFFGPVGLAIVLLLTDAPML